jgi:phospho-N-acetylmuramoyl-pentapeptide-transferase
MAYYLYLLWPWFQPFWMLQYVTVRAIAGAGTAFLLAVFLGPWAIRRLQRLCSGEDQRYQDDAPALDALREKKKTTPTLGGLIILGALVVATLLWARSSSLLVWLALLTTLAMGAIGFFDDYIKVVRRKPKGLPGRHKILLQLAWLFLVFLVLWAVPDTRARVRELMVPFLKAPLVADLGFLLAFVFLCAVVVGSSHAVNLTDGLDGLAIGCTGSVAFAYLVMAYAAGHFVFADHLKIPFVPGAAELSVFCGCLLGASLGFLWHNCHPARIFMGDTGSLALGGAVGMVAVLIKQELALVVVGGVFVAEALSVILQVASFKLTGRRLFRCAPLHHHFELKPRPWSETQVTVRFWILSIVCALLGILLLKVR